MTTDHTNEAGQPASVQLDHARLTGELADLDLELAEREADLSDADQEVREAERGLNHTLGEARRIESPQAAIADAERRCKSAKQERADRAVAVEKLRTRRREILEALHDLAGGSLGDVAEAQHQADVARQAVERLEGEIALSMEALDAIPDGAEAQKTETDRKLLLAAIRLGEADEDALATFDQERYVPAQAAEKERARLRSMADGLRMRLDSAKADAERLDMAYRQSVAWYLRSEMQAAAERYRSTAEVMLRHFGEMIGYSRLIDQINPSSKVHGNAETHYWMTLPPTSGDGVSSHLEGLADDGNFRADAAERVRLQVEAKGLLIPRLRAS